jgi:hypothetical protein
MKLQYFKITPPQKYKIVIQDKKKNRRILRQRTEELLKEYPRTPQQNQKAKPSNHGHQRKRKGTSERYRKHNQQINSRKYSKSQERDAHPDTETSRISSRHHQNRNSQQRLKLKAVRDKNQIIYKSKSSK